MHPKRVHLQAEQPKPRCAPSPHHGGRMALGLPYCWQHGGCVAPWFCRRRIGVKDFFQARIGLRRLLNSTARGKTAFLKRAKDSSLSCAGDNSQKSVLLLKEEPPGRPVRLGWPPNGSGREGLHGHNPWIHSGEAPYPRGCRLSAAQAG